MVSAMVTQQLGYRSTIRILWQGGSGDRTNVGDEDDAILLCHEIPGDVKKHQGSYGAQTALH